MPHSMTLNGSKGESWSLFVGCGRLRVHPELCCVRMAFDILATAKARLELHSLQVECWVQREKSLALQMAS